MRLEVAKVAGAQLMTAEGGDLPDVNVWLALAAEEHPHHAAARSYWECPAGEASPTAAGPPPTLWFNRVTMLALVRLLCEPKVMGTAALGLPQAFGVYRGFADLPEVGMRAEPPTCDATLSTLIASPPTALPSRLWTDAYLAAFAISSGLRLVTFDRDFDRFAGLNCLRLSASAA